MPGGVDAALARACQLADAQAAVTLTSTSARNLGSMMLASRAISSRGEEALLVLLDSGQDAAAGALGNDPGVDGGRHDLAEQLVGLDDGVAQPSLGRRDRPPGADLDLPDRSQRYPAESGGRVNGARPRREPGLTPGGSWLSPTTARATWRR